MLPQPSAPHVMDTVTVLFENRTIPANVSSLSYRHNNSLEKETLPPWMAAYVDLHKSRVVPNMNGAFHFTNEPYLEWVCRAQGSCGGLGDRLYGIVMSLYVAMLTNRTLIVEGWHTPVNMTSFLQPTAHIQWDLPPPSLPDQMISTVDSRNHPYLVEPCKQFDAYKGIEFHNNLMINEPQFQQSDCLTAYWNRFGGRQDDRPLFHIGFWTLLRFTPIVHDRADYLRQAAGLDADQPYVGVHIRTGKGSTWDDPVRHGTNEDLRHFYECAVKLQTGMKKILNAAAVPNMYIAADNGAAKEQIQSWNADGTAKMVSNLEVFHIDRTRATELGNVDQAYWDVFGELKVLIDATCLVMSRSKFSFIGSELSPQQPRCAIMFNECSDANVTKVLDRLIHN